MTVVVGVDAGNKFIKLFGPNEEMMIASELGEYRVRRLEQSFTDDDIIFEFKGRKGFAGTLAQYESQFSASRMGDSKAHDDMLIRVLIGLHRYSVHSDYQIVIGQPIAKHTKKEKQKMKEMLEGVHEITVNGETKQINIERAEIAAEGGAAFWSSPKSDKVRILDIGSGTVNGATLIDGRYIDKDSFTLKDGLETLLTDDIFSFVRNASVHALKYWDVDDAVYVCGGGAEQVIEHLHEYFPQAQLLYPSIKKRGERGGIQIKHLAPVYANAVGFYNIAKKVMQND